MNIYFLFVQAIDIIAWLLIVLSYYRKDTNRILVLQVISTILYCLHYFLLGAYSGLFICAFEVVRDYLYYKTDKDDIIFIISAILYLFGSILSIKILVDLLPIIASLVDGFTLTKKKKIVVIGAITSYTLWVIYDIFVMSYSGAITDGIVVLSNISILLFQFDLLKGKDLRKGIRNK